MTVLRLRFTMDNDPILTKSTIFIKFVSGLTDFQVILCWVGTVSGKTVEILKKMLRFL